MPCCVENCQRCAAHFGGFKFPWLGLWNSRGVVLPPDVAPNEAWDYFYRHQERMDLFDHPTCCRKISMACSSGAQRVTLGSWDLAKFSTNGVPGSTASAGQELPGGTTLASLGTSRISSPPGTSRCSWARHASSGDPTRCVCWSCCVGLCSACFTWRQRCGHCGERRKMLSEV